MNEELFKALVWKKAQNGLTNKEIGQHAGLGKETVRKALLPNANPHAKTVEKLEAWLNAEKVEEPDNWIRVEEKLPESQNTVYVCIAHYREFYDDVFVYPTVAKWIPAFTFEDEDEGENFSGDCDYDEAEDKHYWPEGWYEWQTEPDTNWMISETVTHWQPIPEPPKVTIDDLKKINNARSND